MTRTEAQKRQLWRLSDRQRGTFIRKGEALFLNALNRQIAPCIIAASQGKEKPENYVTELNIAAAYEELYPQVFLFFARDSYKGLMQAKADPESQWMRFVRNFVKTKGGDLIKEVSDTTRSLVRQVLDKGLAEGLGIDKIANFMKSEFGEINKRRAVVITRTEIIRVSNAGSLEGAKSTGLKLNKVWLATPNARTRDAHAAADGQKVPLDGKFTVNGEEMEYPGDPAGTASNTIRCRCSVIYESI